MMNKIEVNTKLFITCRLCLDDQGLYQIVPAVKEQIWYCFDIQVEPFDGLPQLICKKCEAILSNYSEIKKKFIEKQNDLRSKIQGSYSGQVSLTQLSPNDANENLGPKKKTHNLSLARKRIAYISTSSSDLEYADSLKKCKIEKVKNNEDKVESWPESYTKQYVCRICDSRWTTSKSLKNHINSKHSALNKKYSYIFNRHCEVKLHKVNNKPNITGSKSKVMHTREKITKNVSPKYYVVYTIKDCKKKKDKHRSSNHNDNQNHESSDSSEDDIVFKRKRVKRIYSRSSNDTVVLDTPTRLNNNMSDNDKESQKSGEVPPTSVELVECINIDDSSDSESENSKNALEEMPEEQKSDIGNELLGAPTTVYDVINTCHSKFIKKHCDNVFLRANKDPNSITNQLKRKVLSIGRKIINKKIVVNCTPLLRFMEYKNLDIAWLARDIVYVSPESNYIRIMTRAKNIGEYCDYETGWSDFSSGNYEPNISPNPDKSVNVEISSSEPNYVPNGIDIFSKVPTLSVPQMALEENEALATDASLFGNDTKKLLNANPVANPKQLPKKCVTKQIVPTVGVTSEEYKDREFCMPIITSTTSLAAPFSVESDKDDPHHNQKPTSSQIKEQKAEAPRIKVKPVSELMSVETLIRMQEPMSCIVRSAKPVSVQNENKVVNVYVPQTNLVPQFQNTLQQNNAAMNLIAPEPAWQNEFMVLDTTELPNTKTNSPFLYLKQLLQLHNITLLDQDAELSKDFNCLIKFKVLYKQDTKNEPVVLCQAMFCSKNVFCLKVKDRNQDNLNLTKVSPNWQWEVLKMYRGEVVNKLLNNAQKIGQDVYEFTNSFLCLVKSINLVKTT